MRPNASFSNVLSQACESYNNTISKKFNLSPKQANHAELDPLLRRRLYGPDAPLEPFDTYLAKQLKLQKKVNEPRMKVDVSNEHYTQWRVNDKGMNMNLR